MTGSSATSLATSPATSPVTSPVTSPGRRKTTTARAIGATSGTPTFSPTVGSASQRPNLFLESYGIAYGLDIFALAHNAVRRDLCDVYDVIYAYELRRGDVHLSDLQDFFKWFKPIARFILDTFELEGEIGSEERQIMKSKIVEGIRETEELKSTCAAMAPVGVFRKALESISVWVNTLLEYYHHEESSLAALIENEYTVEEKVALDLRVVDYFLECDNGGMKLYNLTRWMDGQQLSYWKETNLTYRQRMQFKGWEMQYKKSAAIKVRILKKSGIDGSQMETRQTVKVMSDEKRELRQTWAEVKKQVEKEEKQRIVNELKNIETEIGPNVRAPQVFRDKEARTAAKQAA